MAKVVLVHPEIPPNTGNIARTCAATGTELHLIQPLGFELSDRQLKRAGLDYWPHVNLHIHESWAAFTAVSLKQGGRLIGFSTKGTVRYSDITYKETDWLLFGRETQGLSPEILSHCPITAYIPMKGSGVRSLNLSVSAAVGLFESLRQQDASL
jgi:tRNA (cytidine/uridine-2'-O-)-methyltransferase